VPLSQEISWGRFAPYQEHLAQPGDAWDKKAASPEEASLYGRGRNNKSLKQQLAMSNDNEICFDIVASSGQYPRPEWHCDCIIHDCLDGGGLVRRTHITRKLILGLAGG